MMAGQIEFFAVLQPCVHHFDKTTVQHNAKTCEREDEKCFTYTLVYFPKAGLAPCEFG